MKRRIKKLNPMKSWRPKAGKDSKYILEQDDKPYYKTVSGKKARLYKMTALGLDGDSEEVFDIAPKGNYSAMKKIMDSKVIKFIESDNFDSLTSREKSNFLKDNLIEKTEKYIIFCGEEVKASISGKEASAIAVKNGWESATTYLERKNCDTDSFNWGYYSTDVDFVYITGDNSYNSNVIAPVTNLKIYKNKHTGELVGNVSFHLGGDIRGNYSEGIVIEGDDEDDIFMTWYEEFCSSMLFVTITFTDGSELKCDFDSQGYLESILADFGIAKYFKNTDKELISELVW